MNSFRAAKTAGLTLGATLLLWLCFSWPLPRYMNDGIPSTPTRVEHETTRRMVQGDHLQLLYSYWLFADVATGQTPFYYNLYEFNAGDDEERRCGATDDFPLSLFFTPVYTLAGRALAWNLTGLLSLWLTLLFTWTLLRSRGQPVVWTLLAALLAIALPYRWSVLCGGSPTGLAMTWVPLFMLGLDAAIRREKMWGGLVAGMALFLAYLNDSHVFFFVVLIAPVWGLVVLLLRPDTPPWRNRRWWGRMIVACLPVVLVLGGLMLAGRAAQGDIVDSMGTHGRSWMEVALCSPWPRGLVARGGAGADHALYLGLVLPVLLLVGLLAQLVSCRYDPVRQWRRTLAHVLLVLSVSGIVILALGTRGPFDGYFMELVRRLVSPYALIRQPLKILIILPPLLAVLALLSLESLADLLGRRRALLTAGSVVLLATMLDYNSQIKPGVCLLDREQGAYAAVAADAKDAPRALVLPIWPGDSSWSSLYEHYVSLYHIRMLNGYAPVPPMGYSEKVALLHDPANVGRLAAPQIEDMERRGIEYIILHEDAFPEQVSSYAVAFTLHRLLIHPRLELLKQDENIWAFKLLKTPRTVLPALPDWPLFFPSRYSSFEIEHFQSDPSAVVREEGASGDHLLSLPPQGPTAMIGPIMLWQSHDTALLLRVRGNGSLRLELQDASGEITTNDVVVHDPDWRWERIPCPVRDDSATTITLGGQSGHVEADVLLVTAGQLPRVAVGESFSLAPPLFFHAGYTDLAHNAVVLRAESEPHGEIFYGPMLPLAAGHYSATLRFSTDAPVGTRLGTWNVAGGVVATQSCAVVAGAEARCRFETSPGSLPLRLSFDYLRQHDIMLRDVKIARVAE
ncbi:MAG: hypothetical protein HQ523_04010 [Lentisphaerae bacterium]|nr:hypothetical protein [Lentisphaerota bacterium]